MLRSLLSHRRFLLPVLVLVLAVVSACGSPGTRVREEGPSDRSTKAAGPSNTASSNSGPSNTVSSSTASSVPGSGPITEADAIRYALRFGPEVSAADWSVRQNEALEVQAGALPNPGLQVDLENFFGSAGFQEFRAGEVTVWAQQLFELGGKRAARMALAARKREYAEWQREIEERTVVARVRSALARLLVARDLRELLRKRVEVVVDEREAVEQRVRSGSEAPLESGKTRLAMLWARIDLENAERALEAAARGLAACWGAATVDPERIRATLAEGTPSDPPPVESLLARLDEHPLLRQWERGQALADANVELAASSAWPDVTVSVGYRRLMEVDEDAMVASFAVPLPLFDLNRSGTEAARYAVHVAREQRAAARLVLRRQMLEVYGQVSAAQDSLEIIDRDVLPLAQKTYDDTLAGYRIGRFDYLELLESQRSLIAAFEQREGRRLEYALAVVSLEQLVGPIDAPQKGAEPLGAEASESSDA